MRERGSNQTRIKSGTSTSHLQACGQKKEEKERAEGKEEDNKIQIKKVAYKS